MKPIEVFLKYCKIRGLIPIMKKLENNRCCSTYRYVPSIRCYDYITMNFKHLVNQTVEEKGFNDLFFEVEYSYRTYPEDEKYRYARSRWNSFVKNNIKLKVPIEKGDKVTISRNGETEEYVFYGFCDGYRTMIVYNDDGRNRYFPVSYIKKINDEDYVIDYYIRWKGKEYGIDK